MDKLIFVYNELKKEIWDSSVIEWIPVAEHPVGESKSGIETGHRESIFDFIFDGEVLQQLYRWSANELIL